MRALALRFAPLLGLTERLLVQERTSKNKLYSLHAPEVVCIAKGKAHRPYEFGSKAFPSLLNIPVLGLARCFAVMSDRPSPGVNTGRAILFRLSVCLKDQINSDNKSLK